jgi:rod shape-determining protein MreC
MRTAVIFIVIIFLLIFLQNVFGILNSPNEFLLSKTSFINSFFYNSAVNFKNSYENYKNFRKTAEENQKLKQQIENLTAQIADLQFLGKENQTLKDDLHFLKEKKFNFVSGKIFNQNLEEQTRVLMIDKGTNDGVNKNFPVVSAGGILIGIIDKTDDSHSLIKLLSDNQSQISVLIQNESKSFGLLKGGYDLGMRIELVPQGEKIETGNFVVSSGLDKNIPAGLLIGFVESVRSNPHEPFQTVFIKSAASYDKITTATILTE